MHVRLIVVPYDSGHRAVRMGAGPLKLAAAGDRLRSRGVEVTVAEVEAPAGFHTEIGTTFAFTTGRLRRNVSVVSSPDLLIESRL